MAAVEIRAATLRDASYVVANMRQRDADEVWCQLPDGVKSHEVTYNLLMASDAFTAFLDGVPAMFFGTSLMNAAALSAWAIGTSKAQRVVPAVTRFLVEEHLPDRVRDGFVVMEARSHIDHVEAHRWMLSTGAQIVGEPFPFGRSREKFLLFRWTEASFGAIKRKRRRAT